MRPGGIGVGLKIAYMCDRRVEVEWLGGAPRHRPVHIVAPLPVERHRPSLIARRTPSLGKPQQWVLIASVLHEFNPLAIGDRSVRKAIRLDKNIMARPFAVEGETAALVPDLHEPTIKTQIIGGAYRLRLDQKWFGQFVSGLQWVLRK